MWEEKGAGGGGGRRRGINAQEVCWGRGEEGKAEEGGGRLPGGNQVCIGRA